MDVFQLFDAIVFEHASRLYAITYLGLAIVLTRIRTKISRAGSPVLSTHPSYQYPLLLLLKIMKHGALAVAIVQRQVMVVKGPFKFFVDINMNLTNQ